MQFVRRVVSWIDMAVVAELVQDVERPRERQGVLVGSVAVNTRNMQKNGYGSAFVTKGDR